MRELFEPGAPPAKARLSALEKVASSGVKTWAVLGPILPGVVEAELDDLLDLIAATGTKVLIVDRLRVRPVIWEKMKKVLRDHPVLKYMHRKALWEDLEYFPRILSSIRDRCRELGLVYKDAFLDRNTEGRKDRHRSRSGETMAVAGQGG